MLSATVLHTRRDDRKFRGADFANSRYRDFTHCGITLAATGGDCQHVLRGGRFLLLNSEPLVDHLNIFHLSFAQDNLEPFP